MDNDKERESSESLAMAVEPDQFLLCTSTIFGFGNMPAEGGFLKACDDEGKHRLAASVFENTRDGIMITDAEGRIIDVNGAFCRITGFQQEEAIGQTPRILRSGEHPGAFYATMWQSLEYAGYWRGEIWNRRKSGELFLEYVSVSAIKNAAGEVTHYVAIYTDISELKASQEQLEHLAYHDSLTGLPNRVLLADRIKQALVVAQRRSSLLAVCYADIDNFKPINDQFGHEVGDKLLIEIGERLRQVIRGGDTVARIGGDEFAMLLCDLHSEEQAREVLGRIVETIGRPIRVDGEALNIGISVGYTLVPTDPSDPDVLLRHADQAMYQAKLEGRNRYYRFDLNCAREVRSQQESIAQMREALLGEQFKLYFQPKVNLRTGRVQGVEALIRWQHPSRGLLLPGEFLLGIGNHDLLSEIGDWAIREVLRLQRRWNAEGMKLPVSINLAAVHLSRSDFYERLQRHLADFPDVDPQTVEFEILETAALGDLPHVSRLIGQCRNLGIEFALDDFGTGYSSLLYLKRLPARTLKVDQSFVRDLLETPEGPEAMSGIVVLANAFKRNLVAEGLEVVEQGIALLRLKCETAQGFGIARPMPAEILPAWMSNFRADPSWQESLALPWRNSDFPLLAAEVEQRRWLEKIETAIDSLSQIDNKPAISNLKGNRFGAWFNSLGRMRYGFMSEFRALPEIVNRTNRISTEIIGHLTAGDFGASRSLLAAYKREDEALRSALIALRRASAQARLGQAESMGNTALRQDSFI